MLFGVTQRPQSSSFLGVPYRILNMNPQNGPLGKVPLNLPVLSHAVSGQAACKRFKASGGETKNFGVKNYPDLALSLNNRVY